MKYITRTRRIAQCRIEYTRRNVFLHYVLFIERFVRHHINSHFAIIRTMCDKLDCYRHHICDERYSYCDSCQQFNCRQ